MENGAMLEYQVLYASRTGNTKQVAKEIFAALPGRSKDICDLAEGTEPREAGLYFVGSCINSGTCDGMVMDALSALHGKQVALFGTCGMGRNREYCRQIAKNIQAFVPEDCEYLGAFLCQGKMPMDVRRKYEELRQRGIWQEQLTLLIENFDEGMLHPDEQDMQHAREFVNQILQGRNVTRVATGH